MHGGALFSGMGAMGGGSVGGSGGRTFSSGAWKLATPSDWLRVSGSRCGVVCSGRAEVPHWRLAGCRLSGERERERERERESQDIAPSSGIAPTWNQKAK